VSAELDPQTSMASVDTKGDQSGGAVAGAPKPAAEIVARPAWEDYMARLFGRPLVVSDRGAIFAMITTLTWLGLVALPLALSLLLRQSLDGAPLIGVVVWLVFLRAARWISPPARADHLLLNGHYAQALKLCDASLRVSGEGAWVGLRRLIWLNRRTSALLGLGRYDEALLAALRAAELSPDSETIATCALASLRLNRYEDAIAAARLTSDATTERSVRANATLAACMLARKQPAEAEALASASLADIEALSPYVRRESYASCLSALVRARRAQGMIEGREGARAALARLQRIAGRDTETRAVALLEEATLLAATRDTAKDAEIERLTREARALAPGYTLWRLAQEDAPATTMNAYLRAGLAAQQERAIPSLAVASLLRDAGASIQPRPAALSNSSALLAQILTVAATLALLVLWIVVFFFAGAS
jgi:tetratricopeptide (TPR) repeat protein